MYTIFRPALVGLSTYYLLDTVLPSGSLTIEIRKGLFISVISLAAAVFAR